MSDGAGSRAELPSPSIRAGWLIFATRPVALVVTLIVCVVLVLVSFGTLAFPVIAAFYHTTRQSKRERYFIDLERVVGMLAGLGRGMRRHFFQSYVIGILGLAAAIALLVVPVLLVDHPSASMALLIELLFLPAFFWSGATLLHAYPCLIETGSAGQALAHAWREGRRRPLRALGVGFLVFFPIPGALFHLLMVFSYPILAASSLGVAGDSAPITLRGLVTGEGQAERADLAGEEEVSGGPEEGPLGPALVRSIVLLILFAVLYTAVLLGGGTIIARTWGEAAVVPWTAAGIIALLIILRRFAPRV